MSKKKIEDKKEIESNQVFMSPGQYWEWRTTIEEMHHSETKLKHARLMNSLMEKDIEISKLKSMLYKEQALKSFENQHDSLKKDYEKFKERLEKDLNISLNNKVIDDITFEVKPLES